MLFVALEIYAYVTLSKYLTETDSEDLISNIIDCYDYLPHPWVL